MRLTFFKNQYMIQQTQIKSSRDTAHAQIKSAEIQASEERRLQQGQLTAQLVEHLTSDSEVIREIAIVALRESVDEKIYNAVVEILARRDESAQVRQKAIQQLGLSQDSEVIRTLGEIASDKSRPEDERYLADKSEKQITFSKNLLPGTFILTSSSLGYALETPSLQGGIFTHFLLRGLRGEADIDADGSINSSELASYVGENVAKFSNTRQKPVFSLQSQGDLPIIGENATYSEFVGVIIGVNQNIKEDIAPLRYAEKDAQDFYRFFVGRGIDTRNLRILLGREATKSKILEQLDMAISESSPNSMFIFYYSGHKTRLPSGESALITSDFSLENKYSSLPISTIKEQVNRSKSVAKIIILD